MAPHRLLCCIVFFSALVFGGVPSSVSISSSPNPANYGQVVTLTATVTSGATGKVTFYDGVTPLGVGTISGTQTTITTVLLQSGTRSLFAYYGGDSTYAASSSTSLSQSVVAGASLGFHHAVQYLTSSSVGSIAVGDFNGDGYPDLAVTTANGLSVLLGKGDGTFQTAVNYSTGSGPSSVAVGDFDGDGKMDLAVANLYSSNLSIFLGNGDGTFQAAVNYTVGSYPECLVVGDFNGDGKMDLAVANYYSSNVSILLGNGDGTFQTATSYTTGTYSDWIAEGYFNSDGKTDLVASNYVLLGNGDGTFQAAASYSSGVYANKIAVGDFNGDGKMDLAVTDENSSVSVLLGNGDGTFQTAVSYAAYYGANAIIGGDFNGDGKTDLAVASAYYTTMSVLLGNGDGTFQSPVNYTVGSAQSYAIAVGDLNGDGKADLIVGGSAGISVLLGGALPDLTVTQTQNGGLTEGQQGASYTLIVTNAGDVASLGTVSIVEALAGTLTAVSIGGNGWTCTLATLTCTRSDSLASSASYPAITVKFNAPNSTGNVISSATVSGGGDQNSANNSASNTTYVRLSTATTLAATPNPAVLGHQVTLTATVTSGATGKVTFFDGTTALGVAPLMGNQAILTSPLLPSGPQSLRGEYGGDSAYGPSTSPAWTETVTAMVTNGYQPFTSYTVDVSPVAIAVSDFNGDGKPDIITANCCASGTGTVSVLLGNGNGTFRTALTQAAGAGGALALVVGDFNGDGYPDVAIPSGTNGVYVLLGKGDGTFQSAVAYGQATLDYTSLVVADCNGDGKLDLVALGSGSINVFLGNGDGTFQAPSTVYSGTGTTYFSSLSVADLNGDGKADLIGFNTGYAGPAGVLLGNGDGTFQAPTSVTVLNNTYPMAFAMGDFNGDGKPDLAAIYWTGIAISLGNGDGTFGAPISNSINFVPGYSAIAGDFNGDGKLDVLASGYYSNNVYIAFGNGNGSFSPGAQFAAGAPSSSSIYFALADFNGDGKPDLAVANNGTNAVDVLLGGQFSGLNISSTHAGSFVTSQTGVYQIVVGNPVFSTTTGTITVTDTLPAGLTVATMSGTGWTCTVTTVTCTRSDGLAFSVSYPTISLTVNVAGSLLPSTINNQVSVSNGAFMNTATDPTVIVIPPSVHIDAPAPGTTVSGVTSVSGWAIDNATVIGTAIGNVTVLVDGTAVGNATYGGSRPDVCSAYPGRPGCPNVGYTYQLNTALLTPGQHTITVSANDTDAAPEAGTASVTVTVAVAPAVPPSVHIDAPASGTTVSGTVTVSGWAIDNATAVGTAISAVQVKVDGVLSGTATYGTSRPDVCSAYPGRPACPNVGYTYSLNTAALTAGSHTITVTATDTDSTPDTGTSSVTVTVSGSGVPAGPPSVHIDAPASGTTVSGTVTVSGWAIDNATAVGTAISTVQVKVDEVTVGTATYGTSRPDVCAVYPGRPGCPDVGYTYSLNTAALTAGSHTITVSATDTDASPDTGTSSVTVIVSSSAAVIPSVHIDGPAVGATVSGTVMVSGWAIDNVSTVGTAISSVQVKVDGVTVGTATYGVSRPDVCSAYPGRPGCPNVGFTYSLNTASLASGSHTIAVAATDSANPADTGSSSVTVIVSSTAAVIPSVHIDTPAPGATISGTVTVSGWAINNASTVGPAISSVQVEVDGVTMGTATYGVNRPDVCTAYPGRYGCPNVGFTYSLNTTTLASGSHTITVIATDSASPPDTGSTTVSVVK